MAETDAKPLPWEKVYIFVSSTFNDMHAERDYLVKRVFPELQDWCERRKLRLVDIDLRWGVTERDATHNKNVVKVCLNRIDDCRPFFLCFLGQRRGWVPKEDEVSAETFDFFPDLRSVVGAASVTEMEILHALIKPLHQSLPRDAAKPAEYYARAKYAFFYLRDPSYLDQLPADPPMLRETYTNEWIEDAPERKRHVLALKKWREIDIPNSNRPFHFYEAKWDPNAVTPELMLLLQCPSTEPANIERWRRQWQKAGITAPGLNIEDKPVEASKAREFNNRLQAGRLSNFKCEEAPLSKMIIGELQKAIAERYPTHSEVEHEDELQKEIDQQEQFFFSASEGFIEREGDFAELDDYADSDSNKIFVLTAAGGMGKSTLLANWVDRYRSRIQVRADQSIHFRFIGQSDGTTTVYSLLRLLLSEIKEIAQKFDENIPLDPVKLRNEWPALLAAIGTRGPTVIVIDALDQLDSSLTDVDWLPRQLPGNIKLIVSFKRGDEAAEKLHERFSKDNRVTLSEVKPFANLDDRQLLVQAYLKQYLKELDRQQLAALINLRGAENPLYLKVVLSELRVFGTYGNLTAKIRSDFGDTPVSAFVKVLERLETDPTYSRIDPKQAVPLLVGLLAHARRGLSVDELTNLFIQALGLDDTAQSREDASDTVNLFLRQVRSFLARREGRYDFFFESFTTAAQQCYVVDADGSVDTIATRSYQEWHRLLANYFASLPTWQDAVSLSEDQLPRQATRRKVAELPYHLIQARQWEDLDQTLCSLDFIAAKCAAGMTYDLLSDYDMAVVQIPQGEEKQQSDAGRSARLLRFAREIMAYATDSRTAGGELPPMPEVPTSVIPRETVEQEGKSGRSLPQPLLEFRAFISAAGQALARYSGQPGFCVQHAYNNAYGSVVGQSAEAIVNDSTFVHPCLLRLSASRCSIAGGTALRTTVEAHRVVTVLQQTQDGGTIYSGGHDGTIRIWSAGTGECLRSISLTSPFYQVHGLALSADGSIGITVPDSSDKVLLVWDLNSVTQIGCLEGHEKGISSVAITPDGAIALSAGSDSTLRLWDVPSARCVRVHDLDEVPEFVALSPDARTAIFVCRSAAKFLNLLSGEALSQLPLSASYSHTAAASLDLGWVLIGEHKSLRIWDTRTCDSRTLDGESPESIRTVALTPDGGVGLSAGDDAIIRVWDTVKGRCVRALRGHSDKIVSLCIAPDACYAASGGHDGTMRIWDLQVGSDAAPDLAQETLDPIRAISMSSANIALSQTKAGKTRFWSTETGEDLTLFKDLHMFITDDGRLECSRTAAGIQVRDSWTDRKYSLRLDNPPMNSQEEHPLLSLLTLRIAANGRHAVSHLNTNAWVWDLDAGIPTATIPMSEGVAAVAIAARGHRAAAGGGQPRGKDDWNIRLLDLGTGIVNYLEGHGDIITALEITPDDCVLVSGSRDGTIRMWDLESGVMLSSFGQQYSPTPSDAPFYMGAITQVMLTPEGRRAVILNDAGETWFCHLVTGRLVGPLRTHASNTARKHLAIISPDGKLLFTGGGLRNIYVWDMERVELKVATVEQAEQQCLTVRRSLVAFGDQSGKVTFSKAANMVIGNPLITARRDGPIPCPHCHADLTMPSSVAETIERIEQNTRRQTGLSPCLDLPEGAWSARGLTAACPRCENEILFNPFFVADARTSLLK